MEEYRDLTDSKYNKPEEDHHPKIDNDPDVIKIKNPWKIVAIILGIATIILLYLLSSGSGLSFNLSGQSAGEKIASYLSARTQAQVTYLSSKDLGNLYEITVSHNGQNIPVFITKDGNYFIQAAIPITNQPTQNNPQPQQPSQPIDVSEDDDAIEGNKEAKVTIIEFSDYQCPYCERFYSQTLTQLREKYIKTGKVKLVFRDFPLNNHPQAQKAAEAAECAGNQGKYYDMHDKLFENQNALSINDLKRYAKELNLNTNEFNNCLDSSEMANEVKKDLEDGQRYGIEGTPGFFINGRPLSGAQPFTAFEEIIKEELSK